MTVLCGMPTIQYSTQSAWLSVRLSKWEPIVDHDMYDCLSGRV